MNIPMFNQSRTGATTNIDGTDPYAVLQVAPTASHVEIEASYNRLAAMYSVERMQDGPPEFQQIAAMRREELAAAYAVLGDPDRRAAYDAARAPAVADVPLDYRPLPPARRQERPSPSLALPPIGGEGVAVRRVPRGPRSLVAPLLIGSVVLSVLLVIVLSGVRVDDSPSAMATPAVAQLMMPYSAEQIEQARAEAESVNTAETWTNVGHMYFDNMGTLREAAPLSPQYLQSIDQWMEAVNAYRRALDLGAPASVRADLALALFYHGVSSNDQPSVAEALQQAERAKQDGPDDPRVLLNYGLIMFSSSPPREEEGRAAFNRILEIAPQSFEARSAQALLGIGGQ
jgi:tetratricopeptide (TPR) repeat protein